MRLASVAAPAAHAQGISRASGMALTIREDDRGRGYFASVVARAVVRAGARVWIGTLGLAIGCVLLRLSVQLSPPAMGLTRAVVALPLLLALVVPLLWLAYRLLPCSCVSDSGQVRFHGRGAGRYPFESIVSFTVDDVPDLPGYRSLALRIRSHRQPAAIIVPDSVSQDVLDAELQHIAR